MEINNNNNINRLASYMPSINRTKNDGSASADKVSNQQASGDTVSITSASLSDIVLNQAKSSDDFRTEKVQELKAKIESGEYEINSSNIAEKLLIANSELF